MENTFSSLVKYLSLVFYKGKSLHMQMTVIFPYVIVWNVLNEITCLCHWILLFCFTSVF